MGLEGLADFIPCLRTLNLNLVSKMDYQADLNNQRLIWASVASLAASLSHFTVESFISSMARQRSSPLASWNDEETAALIQFLHTNHAEAGDNGNFKKRTYNAAAEHISGLLTSGPPKTGESVKNKWTSYVSV